MWCMCVGIIMQVLLCCGQAQSSLWQTVRGKFVLVFRVHHGLTLLPLVQQFKIDQGRISVASGSFRFSEWVKVGGIL